MNSNQLKKKYLQNLDRIASPAGTNQSWYLHGLACEHLFLVHGKPALGSVVLSHTSLQGGDSGLLMASISAWHHHSTQDSGFCSPRREFEGSSRTSHSFHFKMGGVMSQHSLQARCHLASPNCKIPVKQEMFQVVDSRQNLVLVSSVNVNPIYSVLSTWLGYMARITEMNGTECFTFKKLVLHWLKIMLTELKDSICINKARHKIDYMEWFQLKKI